VYVITSKKKKTCADN